MYKKNIGHYWKTIVAALGGVIIIGNSAAEAISTGYGDGSWDLQDTVTAVVAVSTVVGVWWKANGPEFKRTTELDG